jgi:hypothetical protein
MDHPLDHTIWTALTTRQELFAEVAGGIRRYRPAFGPFAASADNTAESFAALASLVPPSGQVCLQQEAEIKAPPGLVLLRTVPTVQMVAERIEGPRDAFEIEVLSAADAPEMLALAQLTKPGPFFARTPELGRFVGVRHEGGPMAEFNL